MRAASVGTSFESAQGEVDATFDHHMPSLDQCSPVCSAARAGVHVVAE